MPEWVAGVDEAGRGPLAGPVCAAAVILDPQRSIEGLDDSKRLTAKRRETLFPLIQQNAAAWSIAWADVAEIDSLNILHATMLAMQRAVAGLQTQPQRVLIDGNRCPELPMPAQAIIGGDALEPAISAASILAKVARDELMTKMDSQHPGYGFAQHSGYGTVQHRAALTALGPCEIHRRSFAPVRQCFENVS